MRSVMSQNRSKPGTSRSARTARPTSPRSGRPGAPKTKIKPATASDWIAGARLRTLPLAVGPVLIGTGAATLSDGPDVWHPIRAALCLVVALCLQIGVNYSNDYSDGVRGTDEFRVGPSRLTGSGRAKPRTVLIVALVFFALAGLAGIAIVIATHLWWLLIVGAAAIAAAWFYTGGRRPYGYYGLGEVFVFLFFGLVATLGTTFVQARTLNQEAWFGAVAAGLFACAVLMVNNLRDIEPDRLAGKRTLAVLVGPKASKVIFCVFALVPFGILALLGLLFPFAWYGFFVLFAVIPACLIAVTARSSRELILALQLTSLSGLAYALVVGVAFAF